MQISEEVLTKTINYLAKRPWIEVFQLMSELNQEIAKNKKQNEE